MRSSTAASRCSSSRAISPSSEGSVGEIGQGSPAPPSECLVERGDRSFGIGLDRAAGTAHVAVESQGVQLLGFGMEDVARSPALDALGTERAAKVRHVALDGVARRTWRLLRPDRVDELVHRDDAVRRKHEVREHQTLLRTAQRDRAPVERHLKRPEHPAEQDAGLIAGHTVRPLHDRGKQMDWA